MNKKIVSLSLTALAVLTLGACSQKGSKDASETKLKVAMVTDQGGIDDKSFNQSAWEGLQAWGKSQHVQKGRGFDYFQSSNESEYVTNLETAASSGYNLVFGIGFNLTDAIKKAAEHNKDTKYAIVDDVIEGKDNVASITFADNEAAYLAGVAAAKTTKTKKIGFVGGMEGTVVKRFESGFAAGVKSVDPSIKLTITYAGSFADAAKGKSIAATQYASGADVIYQAAGGTGAGVFNEAKAINEKRSQADKVWVIGVDRDQKAEGHYTDKSGKKANFVLASSIKEVGKTMQKVIAMTEKDTFPGGKVNRFGIKEDGVDLTTKDLPAEVKAAVDQARKDITAGKITVPEK
ncbi:BMP family lipoprotein [Streptococcus halichoeri]|uniref:BMP family lipoprotein n=1 Tax=Streptococcus halichoeri TaxID=254785 RepID=UPI000DB05752|nr:BMP family protein [Streptococcus halichoeri]PZO96522.1 MAG: BMP family ABC transporter substrate-binding protein [Streptococcus pyogenes]